MANWFTASSPPTETNGRYVWVKGIHNQDVWPVKWWEVSPLFHSHWAEVNRPDAQQKAKKVYISGQITGDPLFRNKFEQAEKNLKHLGYIVLNPANHPEGLTNRECMRIDLAMIDAADSVYFLSDWNKSRGAKLEMAYAEYMGKEIMGAGWKID